MADKFSHVSLGDVIFEVQKIPVKAAAAITKGQALVWDTHTDDEFPTVNIAGADATDFAGVAMEDIAQDAVGMMLKIGIIKATVNGAVAAGDKLSTNTAGTFHACPVAAAGDFAKLAAAAVQDGAAGDNDILIQVGML